MSNPFDSEEWREFVAAVRTDAVEKIAGSAAMISIVPEGEYDVKFAVELGLGIMMDKPLIILVQPGAKIPEKLRLVADEVVEADIDLQEGRDKLGEALKRLGLANIPR